MAGRSPMPLTIMRRSTSSTSLERNSSLRGSSRTMAYLMAATRPSFDQATDTFGVRYPSAFT
jgi:hypothetical protein